MVWYRGASPMGFASRWVTDDSRRVWKNEPFWCQHPQTGESSPIGTHTSLKPQIRLGLESSGFPVVIGASRFHVKPVKETALAPGSVARCDLGRAGDKSITLRRDGVQSDLVSETGSGGAQLCGRSERLRRAGQGYVQEATGGRSQRSAETGAHSVLSRKSQFLTHTSHQGSSVLDCIVDPPRGE